jgi:hypothetical protein
VRKQEENGIGRVYGGKGREGEEGEKENEELWWVGVDGTTYALFFLEV